MALIAMATGLSACGGSSKTSASSSKPTSTSTTTSTATSRAQTGPPAGAVAETAKVAESDTFSPSTTARPGDTVALRTVISGSASSGPQDVAITIDKNPGTKLTATAQSLGQSSTATIASATGRPVSLLDVHYVCELPPTPTFCPAKAINSTAAQYQLQFSATHASGIELTALVGPTPDLTAKTVTVGRSAAPPYAVTELVRSQLASPSTTPVAKPAASVTAGPGDVVTMYSILKGVAGARQPVTVTVGLGPSKSITVSAAVPGGHASTATINGKGGSSIALTLPRYGCFVPPRPTFCPATKIRPRPSARTHLPERARDPGGDRS